MLSSNGNRLTALWAKARRGSDSTAYHPLLCHLTDVAQVTLALWDRVLPAAAKEHAARVYGMTERDARVWTGFLSGSHDIGKACPAFQSLHPVAAQRVVEAGWPMPATKGGTAHGIVTARALRDILPSKFGLSRPVAVRLADAVGGHHGVFPSGSEVQGIPPDDLGRGPWGLTRSEMMEWLAEVLHLPSGNCPQKLDNGSAMWLAGLVSVADWIGSNEDFFPYAVEQDAQEDTLDLNGYLLRARCQAEDALARLGWLGWEPKQKAVRFTDLFPFSPNQMQQQVVALSEKLSQPALVIVEASMGMGKTEAAMWLADSAAVHLGQRGCYFALPTQATSNGMFERVRDFLGTRFPKDVVNLQLLHGGSSLSTEFEEMKQSGNRLFGVNSVYGDPDRDSPASVVAAEWFTYKKRGLLAPFGVGTVDQALLAVLQVKHVFVRLFGLADKVVVIDEVHAYDTYMSTLLQQLLQWLATLGTTVVLLSATLPKGRRQALVDAYRAGLDLEALPLPVHAYPRITWAEGEAQPFIAPVESSEGERPICVRWLRNESASNEMQALGEQLRELLSGGGCAAVICNTVRRAQDVYRALKPFFSGIADDGLPTLDLLHAQFPYSERQEREQRTLQRFGKTSAVTSNETDGVTRRPTCAIQVATQVIEQSLDLDFDLMVTDLAPVDLVLQRAGRLHRHKRPRPSGLTDRPLWIMGETVARDGTPRFDAGSQHVYEPHVLLRSWLTLQKRAQISLPGDIDEMIEFVYDDRACPEDVSASIEAFWKTSAEELEKHRHKEAAEAEKRDLRPPWYDGILLRGLVEDSMAEDAPDFHQAHQALTRLTGLTAPVILLSESEYRKAGAVLSTAEAKDLLRRSLTISHEGVARVLLKEDVPNGWAQSPLLRNYRPIVLDNTDTARIGPYNLHLDGELGLVITRTEEAA